MNVKNALAAVQDQEQCLQLLQQCYGDCIGVGLDVAEVAAYWWDEAPLAAPWRRALAERIELKREGDAQWRAGGHISRARLASLMDRRGCVQSLETGGGVFTAHDGLLEEGAWQVSLNHDPIRIGCFNAEEETDLNELVVYQRSGERQQAQRLGELPPAFSSTLLAQARSLHEAAR